MPIGYNFAIVYKSPCFWLARPYLDVSPNGLRSVTQFFHQNSCITLNLRGNSIMDIVIVDILFGWPTMLLALFVSLWGVSRRSCPLLIIASVLSLPFSLYIMGGTGVVWKLFLFIPLSFLFSCYFIRKNKENISWLLILIDIVMILYIGISVATQNRG